MTPEWHLHEPFASWRAGLRSLRLASVVQWAGPLRGGAARRGACVFVLVFLSLFHWCAVAVKCNGSIVTFSRTRITCQCSPPRSFRKASLRVPNRRRMNRKRRPAGRESRGGKRDVGFEERVRIPAGTQVRVELLIIFHLLVCLFITSVFPCLSLFSCVSIY